MNCFGELFVRYQKEVMGLCIDECADAERLYCVIDPEDLGQPDPCFLCDRHRYDDGGKWRDTCNSPACESLTAWYEAAVVDGGYKRRQIFKQHFGKPLREMDRSVRREAILTIMLLVEANEKANAGRKKLSVAA